MLIVALTLALATPPVVDAVKSGDRAAAVRLIDQRADVNAPQPDGTTALHWAAVQNDLDLVQRLVRAGAKAAAVNEYGATPLSEAAILGNAAIIDVLLKAGADVESPNHDGQTALMLVARTGNVEAARLLLKRGAKVNARERWREQTPLMWAAAQRQGAMVKELIAHGADVDALSMVNRWKRQVSAEPRALHRPVGGLTPLLFAAREGCVDCAKALVDAGADVDLADPEEISPLLMALINIHFDVAAYLIEAGADIETWDIFGRTPLYMAVDMNTLPRSRADQPSLDQTTSLQLIETLLKKGANPNTQLKLLPPMRNILDDRGGDRQLTIGATPLMRAAKAMDADAIRLLLAHGAKPDLPNAAGMTPVMAAAGLASVDADSRGIFTTDDVQKRSIAALELLLEAGVDINRKDGVRGQTALHEAARWGWNDVVKYLVAHGADLDATDLKGMTPVDSALGKAGGNSRFGQRIDVFENTAALLRELKAAKAKTTSVQRQ